MATRSRIGIELKNGSIVSAYHHSDGYPEWLGKILKEHYNSYEKASELIDGGDMSCCWTKDRWNYDGSSYKAEEYGVRYYVREIDGDNPPRLDEDLCEYLLAINAEEYHYLFRNGEWICYEINPLGNELPKIIEIPSGVPA